MDEETRQRILALLAANEAARDQAMMLANQHQGAVDVLRALLAPPPPPPPPDPGAA